MSGHKKYNIVLPKTKGYEMPEVTEEKLERGRIIRATLVLSLC